MIGMFLVLMGLKCQPQFCPYQTAMNEDGIFIFITYMVNTPANLAVAGQSYICTRAKTSETESHRDINDLGRGACRDRSVRTTTWK